MDTGTHTRKLRAEGEGMRSQDNKDQRPEVRSEVGNSSPEASEGTSPGGTLVLHSGLQNWEKIHFFFLFFF